MSDMCSFVKKIQVKDAATAKDVTTMKWLKALQTILNATLNWLGTSFEPVRIVWLYSMSFILLRVLDFHSCCLN
jgi:hypothetical protein